MLVQTIGVTMDLRTHVKEAGEVTAFTAKGECAACRDPLYSHGERSRSQLQFQKTFAASVSGYSPVQRKHVRFDC